MTDYGSESADIERRRKYAEMLREQSMQPLEGGMAGGWAIPISPTQGLAKALQAYAGAKGMQQAKTDQQALGQRLRTEATDWAAGMPQAQPAQPERFTGDAGDELYHPATEAKNPTPQEMSAYLLKGQLGGNPLIQQTAAPLMAQALKASEGYILNEGAQKRDASGKVIAENPKDFRPTPVTPSAIGSGGLRLPDGTIIPPTARPTVAPPPSNLSRLIAERDALPQGDARRTAYDNAIRKESETPKQIVPGNVGGGARAPLGYRFSSDGETLEPIPGGPKDQSSKALPTQALKLQQAELDAIGTGASIVADLAAVNKQIDDGKIDLGLISNLVSQGRTAIGAGTEQSRNFNSFKTTLEKLRNDSLRLNKGVQTEGDAIRAWNELMGGLNDKGTVQQRLKEIGQINERAVNLRKMNIDAIRSNYGAAPMDVSGYERQPAAVGSPKAATPSSYSDAEKERRYQEWKKKNGG
ncbi:hypothetical protein UFOVP1095_37 [uncultured Caudovirales phage]|uniref:Uncharacterized protein n=1 Tax=uncultured Caudovirales phage TaxID=2100421 RepID=A0A6J5QGN0_9CAUD|nr:hypothetical protein UFOVP918_37 [uncultured Caudovirales phage]CAB4182742.1 hypothetical protein UFOVP1095_37 [uncultured Caudovirales phage]CAB4214279.1 hypothetical protein UFOVP1452_37 [uncultured Caudovirales phage]CAB5228321.1 hypothetical protein UFOVP1540_14 [uncultured Caudovirales phage]